MDKIFESWTEYDEWLKENCETYTIYLVEEKDNKIRIEYKEKE